MPDQAGPCFNSKKGILRGLGRGATWPAICFGEIILATFLRIGCSGEGEAGRLEIRPLQYPDKRRGCWTRVGPEDEYMHSGLPSGWSQEDLLLDGTLRGGISEV